MAHENHAVGRIHIPLVTLQTSEKETGQLQ